MKMDEILNLIEEFKTSIDSGKFQKLDIIKENYRYENVDEIAKIVIDVNASSNRFDDSLNNFIDNVKELFKFFNKYDNLSLYVRKPIININGIEDVDTKVWISDFDESGNIDVELSGVSYKVHFKNVDKTIEFKSAFVALVGLEKE